MVFPVVILIFTYLGSLESSQFRGRPGLDPLEQWDIKRTKRDDTMSIKDKFPVRARVACEDLHLTDEAPFTAIVLYRDSGRLLCMGSIIDGRHILSAKRCYEKADYNDLKVLVGYYKAYWGNLAQVLKVKQVIRHEFEIVILRLLDPIMFTEHIQAVRLPSAITKKVEEFDKAFPPPYKIVGFLVDRFDVPGDFLEKDKLYVLKEDQFLHLDDCKSNYSKSHLEGSSKLFCTYGNATFCWGAWGSPVVKLIHSEYFIQVGVVVADSCTPNSTGPFLVARTDAYIDWIRGNSFHGHQPS